MSASGITRRDFMKCAAVAAGAAVVLPHAAEALGAGRESRVIVDVNVNLGQWPLRRLPRDEPAQLVGMLESHGVTQAWAGSFEGVLHKDLTGVNARLAAQCRKQGRGMLLPFGSVNPTLPGWKDALEQCARVHQMRGIRLHPNYHGYRLDDPAFQKLLTMASGLGLVVQLTLVMEDERMMHPMLRVAPVDTSPLAEAVRQTPGLRLVLLNALRTLRGAALNKLLSAGDVFLEISMLEGVAGIANLLAQVPVDRVLFGSHCPLFYFESARLKLQESPITPAQLAAIQNGNAARLLKVTS